MKPYIVCLNPTVSLVILALVVPASAHARLSLAEAAAPRASAGDRPAHVLIAHQISSGPGMAYHANCLNGSYGSPSARKSGYHVHGGGASKYGTACSPYLKPPPPQTLSPGSLTNPQLKKQ